MALSIFKITQKSREKTASETDVDVSTSEQRDLGVTDPISEGRAATPGAGEAPGPGVVDLSKTVTPPASDSVPKTPDSSDEPKPSAIHKDPMTKELTVAVNGPVGRIFTDALNSLLASESYMTMPGFDQPNKVDHTKDEQPTILRPDVTVYCWETDSVNVSDMVELTNNVTKHTDRHYVVALESIGIMTPAAGALARLMNLPNMEVISTTDKMAEYLKKHIEL